MVKYPSAKQLKSKIPVMLKTLRAFEFTRLKCCLVKYRLLFFYIASIAYLEFIYRLWNFKNISIDFLFPLLFSFFYGSVLFLLSSLSNEKVNRIAAIVLTALSSLCYCIQLVYFSIFHTPLSLYSLRGAAEAMQLSSIVFPAILKNMAAIILLFVPLLYLIKYYRKISFTKLRIPYFYYALIFCLVSYITAIEGVRVTDKTDISQYTLYYNIVLPQSSVDKLGLATTMRIDFQRLVFGFEQKSYGEENNAKLNENDITKAPLAPKINIPEAEYNSTESAPQVAYNMMDIDFESLIKNENNQELLEMHKYFSSVKPTSKNKYTGIFKGNNLILITAEAFSPYFISPKLTPTLYSMANHGFVFNNFYNPVWGVSTSDGEYVACTGLIPKSGVWSFSRSGKNFMPFVMGNQFKRLKYTVKAYHDHTYTYYDRNISHPNMGYDYKGLGNGLELKRTWPESDLEMINATADDYIKNQPFHVYYMTVSGHMNYNFSGNYIASKNRAYVENLPYSEASKAYIACNLELEFAIDALLAKLKSAGIAENTVIAISADHYPYGLPKECIDELAGHKVEDNFELYKSTFILWKAGMEPVIVDKPCSSLDINPTLSNLFGLEYDSRLLMGYDILSDAAPLVIFSNRSFITDKVMYNTLSKSAVYFDSTVKDTDYIKQINKIVADKFKYSAMILDKDYYNRVVPKNSVN